MPLVVAPVQLEDFDVMEKHADVFEPGDDLVPNPTPLAWPVSTRADAQRRLRFHMARQRQRFQGDATAHYVKVVDTGPPSSSCSGEETNQQPDEASISGGDIISIARWHYYAQGYDFASMVHWELAELEPGSTEWPAGFDRGLHDAILTNRDRQRVDMLPVGAPGWVLMHLVTRRSQRGRGAARLLINWGLAQSDRDAVPAYLEAGELGRPVYARLGFEQLGDLKRLDIAAFNCPVKHFEFAQMVRWPNGAGKKTSEASLEDANNNDGKKEA